MRTLIFITVVIVFAIITVLKQRSSENVGKPEMINPALPGSSGYGDEKIVTLAFSFSKDKDVHDLGEIIEDQIESELTRLISSGHVCNVEFITVGYYLVVAIRAKSDHEKERRKGRFKYAISK